MLRDIRDAREKYAADIVIPFLHWGWEDEGTPSERQRVFARAMLDAGADMVVGSHPHVTQGAESYQGKPIVYSLGNFLFNGFDTEATTTGWLLDASISKQGVLSWRTRVVRLSADGIPTPDDSAASPCGDSKSDEVRTCTGMIALVWLALAAAPAFGGLGDLPHHLRRREFHGDRATGRRSLFGSRREDRPLLRVQGRHT